MTLKINREQLINFMRYEDFEETLYTLSDEDCIECMIIIASSMNDKMERLITKATGKWQNNPIG